MARRIDSGITNLDRLIDGGFIVPSTTLLVGEPGTGKTLFGLQFLFHGARKGEKGLYITGLSEPGTAIKDFISSFAFYDEKLIDGMISIYDYGRSLSSYLPEKALAEIADIIARSGAKRLVLDPLPPPYLFSAPIEYQRYLYRTLSKIKQLGIVAIFIGEHTIQVPTGMEGYMADGIIMFIVAPTKDYVLPTKEYNLFIQIRKMRGTSHVRTILPLNIEKEGLRVIID